MSVSARGPVCLKAVSIISSGAQREQDLAIDASHSVVKDPAGRPAPYMFDTVSPSAGTAVTTATTVNLRLRPTS
jgi:hypothetical protein